MSYIRNQVKQTSRIAGAAIIRLAPKTLAPNGVRFRSFDLYQIRYFMPLWRREKFVACLDKIAAPLLYKTKLSLVNPV